MRDASDILTELRNMDEDALRSKLRDIREDRILSKKAVNKKEERKKTQLTKTRRLVADMTPEQKAALLKALEEGQDE